MQLYLFSDGLQPARYLVEVHGLRPAKIFFRGEHLLDEAVYTEKSDGVTLLYVLQGCTTTRPLDAVNQLNKLQQLDTFEHIVIYTNIPLYGCKLPYILYMNDIFSGYEADVDSMVETVVDAQINKLSKRIDTRIKQIYANKQLKSGRCDVVSAPYNIQYTQNNAGNPNDNADIIASLKRVDIFEHPVH